MIKINVIVKNKFWMQRIAKPEIYFVKKVNKLNLKNKYFNKKKLEFTLLLSDEKEIKKLNKKFRNKNKATDVLSFPMSHKIILNKKKRFGNFTAINEVFQKCYLNDKNTANYFNALINNDDDRNYSRYVFFYTNYLIENNKYDEAEKLTKNLKSLLVNK